MGMDIFDNVVPYIAGEEDKLETEAQKILGSINADATAFEEQSGLTVGATCTRVGVTDGHMAFVSLRFKQRPPPSAEQVKQAMRDYVAEAQKLGFRRPRRKLSLSSTSQIDHSLDSIVTSQAVMPSVWAEFARLPRAHTLTSDLHA